MKDVLFTVAITALILTLGSDLIAIWRHDPAKDDLMELTKLLISWKVIAGGLAAGAGVTFKEEIKALLMRAAGRRPVGKNGIE